MLDGRGLIATLIIGLVAGWLAGRIIIGSIISATVGSVSLLGVIKLVKHV